MGGDERVEGPADGSHERPSQRAPLVLLESAADTPPAPRGRDRQHVRPVDDAAVEDARQTIDEPDEITRRVEGASREPTHALGHAQDRRGHPVRVARPPGLPLEANAGVVIDRGREVADHDRRRRGRGTGRAHGARRAGCARFRGSARGRARRPRESGPPARRPGCRFIGTVGQARVNKGGRAAAVAAVRTRGWACSPGRGAVAI